MGYVSGSSPRYKQVKHVLGWAQYQVRSDQAIRRHWQLICCAFSFCWYHASRRCPEMPEEHSKEASDASPNASVQPTGTGKKKWRDSTSEPSGILAGSSPDGESMVGTLGTAVALLESVVWATPTACIAVLA